MATKKISADKIDLDVNINGNEAQKELNKLDTANYKLTESNKALRLEMQKLEAQGKKNTDTYVALQKSLKENNETIKTNKARMEELYKQIGVNDLSLNQLRKRLKEYQSQLNSMSQSQDPAGFQRMQNKIKEVKDRIGELGGGTKKTSNVLEEAFGGKAVGVFTKLAGAVGGAWGAMKIGQAVLESTDRNASRLEETIAGLSAGLGFLKRAFSNWDFSNFFNGFFEAIEAGAEYANVTDDIKKRTAAYQAVLEDQKTEDQAYLKTVNDVRNSIEKRVEAIDYLIAKHKELAKTQQNIAQTQYDADLGEAQRQTKLLEADLKAYAIHYNENEELINQGKEYNKILEDRAAYVKLQGQAMDPTAFKLYGDRIAELDTKIVNTSETTKQWGRITRGIGDASSEVVQKYIESYKNLSAANRVAAEDTAAWEAKRAKLLKKDMADRQKALEKDKELADAWLAMQQRLADEALKIQQKLDADLRRLKDDYAKSQMSADEKELQSIRDKYEPLLEANKNLLLEETARYRNEADIRLQMDKELDDAKARQFVRQGERVLQLENDLLTSYQSMYNKELAALNAKYDKEEEAAKGNADAIIRINKARKIAIDQLNSATGYQFTADRSGALGKFGLNNNAEEQQLDMADLDKSYSDGLLKTEEYEQAKFNIKYKYLQKELQASAEVMQQISNGMGLAADFVELQKEREFNALDRQKKKELAAVGNNKKKQAEIEEKYKKQELALQKKYADKEFAAKTSAAVAAGALAVIQAFAQLGPIAGAIAAVIVGANTAIQIAKLNEERKKVQQLAGGRYNVVGADDGRSYSATWGGKARTGIYSGPTLVAERGDEMVIDHGTLSRLRRTAPHVINTVMANRVTQRAAGSYPVQDTGYPDVISNLADGISRLNNRLDQGIESYISYQHLEKENTRMSTVKANAGRY